MAAQDVSTRTNTEIEADAMNVLIDILGGDNDSNIAKTLSAYQIKDPSLIIRLSGTRIKWHDHIFGVNQPTKGQ